MSEIPWSNITSVEINEDVVNGTMPPKYTTTASRESESENYDNDSESSCSN